MKKHLILILALFVAAFAFQGCKDAKKEAAEDRVEAREDAREENTTASEEARKDTEEFKDDAKGIADEAKKDADKAGDDVADSNIGEKTKEVGQDIKEGVQEAGSDLKDAGITTAVKAKFAVDDLVKASNIDVDTENGIVTLSGTVATRKELTQALTLAKTVDGVKDVRNRLKISR